MLKNPYVQFLLCALTAAYIRLVAYTTRWEVIGAEHRKKLKEGDIPGIYCFWHGRLLLMPHFRPRRARMVVMISQHNDGELIARTMTHFGFGAVRGSSRKGGTQALREAVSVLRAGDSVAITPDGPRGPRMRAQMGAIKLAQLTGAPLLTLTFSTTRARFARSWDRFLIACPFAKGVIAYGPLINVPREASEEQLESLRLQLEEQMNRTTEMADKMSNIQPIIPDPTYR